jgi:DNA-binding HxlR family transcriptional regulator
LSPVDAKFWKPPAANGFGSANGAVRGDIASLQQGNGALGRNGAGPRPRAGAGAISLFSVPLNGLVLRALADGPMRLSDLRREVGGPAQTTLRGNLANLIEIGVLSKRGRDDKPGVFENELTPFGKDLLLVGNALEAWLDRAPGGPLALESATATAAIKALVGGWASTIVRALAARPLTLTELDRLIDSFTYPALERRLGAMRLASQIEPCPNGDRKRRPYTVSRWLREAIGPLIGAARCERRHTAFGAAPIARIDIEATFLLAAPLLRLAHDSSGHCQLSVEAGGGGTSVARVSGAQLEVDRGEVISCIARIEARPPSRALGSPAAWLDAVIERDAKLLDFGGDTELGWEIVHGLHDVLFRGSATRPVAAEQLAAG